MTTVERSHEVAAERDDSFRKLVEQSVDGVLVVDRQGYVILGNSAASSLLRKPPEALVGYQFGYPAIDDAPVEIVIAPGGIEASVVELRAVEIDWRGREALLINLRDVTARRRVEERLRESEARFRQLFENSIDAIVIADRAGRYLHVNDAACNLFGYSREQLLSMTVRDLAVPEGELSPGAQYESYVSVGTQSGTFVFVRPDGEIRRADYNAFPLPPDNFVSFLRDITEQRSLEERLLQSQKMEAIGKLAGGVAHDFNNLLTAIISFAGFVRDEMPHGDPRRDDIGQVLRAADRASSLTRQLLAFSRRQPIAPRTVDLNALLLDSDRLLRRTLGEDIEIITLLGKDLWPVFIDPAQFEQVVMNLAVNARDAMPTGGKLCLETRNEAPATGNDETPRVLLRVSDTGCGMNEDVKERIFEPFFTTKDKGHGTGLGLSMVYGLVTQAGGSVSVESQPGRGTCFEIRLPRADRLAESEATPTIPSSDLAGSETILVVEDEPMVRGAAIRILSKYGYTVLEAANGAEAVAMMKRHDRPVHLALCDVVMPQMNGGETAEALRATHPELKILFMTGYTETAIVHRGVLGRGIELIGKPFSEQGLLTRVRQILDGSPSSKEER